MPDEPNQVEAYLRQAGFTGLEPATPQPPAEPPKVEGNPSEIDKFLADFGLPKDGGG